MGNVTAIGMPPPFGYHIPMADDHQAMNFTMLGFETIQKPDDASR
jgi:hypothetical protein